MCCCIVFNAIQIKDNLTKYCFHSDLILTYLSNFFWFQVVSNTTVCFSANRTRTYFLLHSYINVFNSFFFTNKVFITVITWITKFAHSYLFTGFSGILNSSGCVIKSELTCVCISEGFPPPVINWSLSMDHTEYLVSHTVSDQAVRSTVTLTVKSHENITVTCFSSNENGKAEKKLQVPDYLSGKENTHLQLSLLFFF